MLFCFLINCFSACAVTLRTDGSRSPARSPLRSGPSSPVTTHRHVLMPAKVSITGDLSSASVDSVLSVLDADMTPADNASVFAPWQHDHDPNTSSLDNVAPVRVSIATVVFSPLSVFPVSSPPEITVPPRSPPRLAYSASRTNRECINSPVL